MHTREMVQNHDRSCVMFVAQRKRSVTGRIIYLVLYLNRFLQLFFNYLSGSWDSFCGNEPCQCSFKFCDVLIRFSP